MARELWSLEPFMYPGSFSFLIPYNVSGVRSLLSSKLDAHLRLKNWQNLSSSAALLNDL